MKMNIKKWGGQRNGDRPALFAILINELSYHEPIALSINNILNVNQNKLRWTDNYRH